MKGIDRNMVLEKMLAGAESRLEYRKIHAISKSGRYYAEAIRNYYAQVRNAGEEDKPLAWTSLFIPVELLYAMGIVPFVLEQYVIQFMAQELNTDYLDLGEGLGFSSESCSPHRAAIGMAKAGLLPLPDLILSTAPLTCDSSTTMFELLGDLCNCPGYFLDLPYSYDEEAVKYLARELQELAQYLKDRTGRRLNQGKLEEILKISRQTDHYFHLTHQLRRSIPSPLRAREAFSAFALRFYCEGLPETLEFFKAQYEETRDKVERQQGGLPEERLRVAWFGLYPFFDMKLIDWMEDTYKASVAADMMNLLPFEENQLSFSDPWETLAWNRLNFMGLRCCLPYEGFKEDMINTCREMNLDGFIFFANFGCKQTSNFFMLLRKDLSKELGLPILMITGDPLDPRITSTHQIKSLLDEYFKTLEAKASKVRRS